jgi:hypothetical protein
VAARSAGRSGFVRSGYTKSARHLRERSRLSLFPYATILPVQPFLKPPSVPTLKFFYLARLRKRFWPLRISVKASFREPVPSNEILLPSSAE